MLPYCIKHIYPDHKIFELMYFKRFLIHGRYSPFWRISTITEWEQIQRPASMNNSEGDFDHGQFWPL